MQTRGRYTSCIALLLGAAVSCSDAPSAPSDSAAHDVSTAIAQTATVAFGSYFPGAQAVELPAACPYSPAAHVFVCTPAATGDLSYTLTYELLDANGRSLDATSDRAASMRAFIDVRGTRVFVTSDGPVTTAIANHHELLVSGLRSATRTFSGTTVSHSDVSGNGVRVRHSVQDAVGSTTNVRFDDGARWPRAGTITNSDVTIIDTPDVVPTTSHMRSTLEFDGTSVVTITTTSDDFTIRCRFDLAGRVATTCS